LFGLKGRFGLLLDKRRSLDGLAAGSWPNFPEGIVVQFVIGKLADTAFPGDPDAIVFLANDDDVLIRLAVGVVQSSACTEIVLPTIIRRAPSHRIPLQYNL